MGRVHRQRYRLALLNAAASQNRDNPAVKRLVDESRNWPLDAEGTITSSTTPEADQLQQGSVDDARTKYLGHLCTRYRMLDFKGMGMSDRVPLQLTVEHIYVPLRAAYRTTRHAETWARNLNLPGGPANQRGEVAITEDSKYTLSESLLKEENRRLVVLGLPGSGKSHILLEMARRLKPALVLDILQRESRSASPRRSWLWEDDTSKVSHCYSCAWPR